MRPLIGSMYGSEPSREEGIESEKGERESLGDS